MRSFPLAVSVSRRRKGAMQGHHCRPSVEHIARSVWLDYFSQANLVAMFTAYFDASGKKDTPVLVVAGFVSEVRRWTEFSTRWKGLLAEQSFEYFHMNKFVARKKPFDKWGPGPSPERDSFFKQLVETSLRWTNKTISTIVPRRSYNAVNRHFQLDETFGGPYSLAGIGCIVRTLKWARRQKIESLIEFIFEDGDEGKGRLDELARRRLKVEPDFKSKQLAPLQAADLVAWEHAKFIKTAHVSRDDEKIRKSLLVLDSKPRDWGVFDSECLSKTCIGWNIPRR